jgi:hypothetical protein
VQEKPPTSPAYLQFRPVAVTRVGHQNQRPSSATRSITFEDNVIEVVAGLLADSSAAAIVYAYDNGIVAPR